MRAAVFIALVVLSATTSCKKIVEDTKKNYILDIMTTGEWYVSSYLNGANDITSAFTGYLFRFNENGTVVSTKGAETKNGTWEADLTDYSITADFPDPDQVLARLNGKWVVKDSGEDYAVAEMSVPPNKMVLTLRKKQ